MRIIVAAITGLIALATASPQAAIIVSNENWRPLRAPLSLSLGDQACGGGWHQALWRDWSGDWWWGPCVPDRSPGFVWRTPGWHGR